MSGWFSADSNEACAYHEVMDAPYNSELSDELVASAAAYEAGKGWDHQTASVGKPASYAEAKALVDALCSAAVDRIVESKGLENVNTMRATYISKQYIEEPLSYDY